MIAPGETILAGQWILRDNALVADEVSTRVNWLIANYLLRISCSADGWTVFYKDPKDERLWELSYPQSAMHGGGPPTLRCVTHIPESNP